MGLDFRSMSPKDKAYFAEIMFTKVQSAEQLKNWVKMFFDLDMPLDLADPESTASPVMGMWHVYEKFLHNMEERPGSILLSCREGAKTLCVSVLELILLLHFKLDIGHASATETQSGVALSYIGGFLILIEPLMTSAGWENISQNKRLLKFKAPTGETPFLKVLICTPKGMNSLHSNLLVVDELDLSDPQALKESKNIVSYSKGRHGMTIFLSTRKYAFGPMNEAINNAATMNYDILRWNIIDMTEYCPPSRHKPEGPKEDRYVCRKLPARHLSEEEFNFLPETEKFNWELVKEVHEGCLKCPLLAVCKKRLSERTPKATGGLYKPIQVVIQKFRENDPDTAESQLMCFSEKTQILMANGTTKDIKDINLGDCVISHTGSKRKVTELFKRPYDGKAISVKNTNWKHFEETVVTPEHPYFVNGVEFKSISDIIPAAFNKDGERITKGDYLSLPTNYNPNTASYIEYSDFVKIPLKYDGDLVKPKSSTGKSVPSKILLNNEFGWILGFYLAEGFIAKRVYSQKNQATGIVFCTHSKEVEYHNKVRDFFSSIGLSTYDQNNKKNKGHTQTISSHAISELFLSLCGEHSNKKTIHENLMDSNMDFLSGILEGFYAGNGTKRVNSYRELTTTSPNLATQLFLIAARMGLCPQITQKPKSANRKQAYLIHYLNNDYQYKQNRTKFLLKNEYNQYRTESHTYVDFKGDVYNIEVEEDHSYIANGVAVHNCWKPGSEGLIYPRFNVEVGKGNVITNLMAYETLIGEKCNQTDVSDMHLLNKMFDMGIHFFAGVDWGYTHDFVIIIMAMLPNGEVWVMDTFASPGLEFADQLEVAKSFRDKYRVQAWFCDTAMPSHLKSFTKNGMRAPSFTKDVLGGIEAIRSKITDSTGKRLFKVLNSINNKKLINAIIKHRFLIDGQGNPTMKPDDDRGIADICDALRYIGQNKFPVKGTQRPSSSWTDMNQHQNTQSPTSTQQMREEIANRISDGSEVMTGKAGRKGSFHWSF